MVERKDKINKKGVEYITNSHKVCEASFFFRFHRNLVGELAVGRLAAAFEPKQPTANLPTANQISMQTELKVKKLHFRVNLLCTLPNSLLISRRLFVIQIKNTYLCAFIVAKLYFG
jgi:hypothetical protein